MLENYKIARVFPYEIVISIVKFLFLGMLLQLVIVYVPIALSYIEEQQQLLESRAQPVRVIANSNTAKDVALKEEIVVNYLEEMKIQQKPLHFQGISNFMEENYAQVEYEILIGDNLLPAKLDSYLFYPQNTYQSVVVKLGEGRGENWFCSMFKRVCDPPKVEKKRKVQFVFWRWIKQKFA